MQSEAAQYDVDPVKQYLQEIGRYPLLGKQQEIDLALQIRAGNEAAIALETIQPEEIDPESMEALEAVVAEGQQAHANMCRANLRLVVSMAKKYTSSGLPILDLIQEGNIGLMTAVDRFDPDRGFKFSTYAAWWIRQSLQRAVENNSSEVRIPVHMRESIVALGRVEAEIKKPGEPLDYNKVAQVLGISAIKLEDVRKSREQMKLVALYKSVVEEDGAPLIDMIADDHLEVEEEVIDQSFHEEVIKAIYSDLKPRELRVLELRFGLKDGRPHTLEEVGQKFGLTRERIRQLQGEILKKVTKTLVLRGLVNQEDLTENKKNNYVVRHN